MPDAVPFVLWSWVPASLLLFWRLPPSRAVVACLLGGWLILPNARFADDVAGVAFPFWIMPGALPSDQWTTKARVIGVAALLGVMAFDPGAWRKVRPSWLDLPMLAWCLVPLASGLANGVGPAGSAADSAYLLMAWGVPYGLGRLYFGSPTGLTTLARGVVAAGLVYVPVCLVEWAVGPIFYRLCYGFHPYQTDGAARYVGFRPIGLLEHGNQLGIWMASAALVACWLVRAGQLRRFWGMPGAVVASILSGTAVLIQSVGAVVLLGLGLATLELTYRINRTWPIALVLALPLVFVGARATNLVDLKGVALRTELGRALADASTRLDRRSLGWRFQVEQRAAKVALQRPWLGWSRWDWWKASTTGERPWGLPSLALGAGGVLGWSALIGVLAAPMVSFLRLGRPASWTGPTRASASALAGVLAINELDSILNAFFFLPVLAASGGLVGLKQHAEASTAWVRRVQARVG